MTQSKPLAQGMSIKSRDQYSKEDALIYGILKQFETYGYDVIEPPSIEYYDVMAASGARAQQTMIKFVDPFGDIMVLQADPTISLTHYMSKQSSTSLRKFAMVSSIHKAYTMHSKRHEHIKQIGVEVFYDQGLYDLEVLELALKALSYAKVNNVVIELGHVGFIPSLLESLNISEVLLPTLSEAIKLKDLPAIQSLTVSYPQSTQDILKDVITWFGSVDEVMEKIKPYNLSIELQSMVDELSLLMNAMRSLDPSMNIIMDCSTVKSQIYYSGLTMSVYSDETSEPILSGGRYDHILEHTGQRMSAIGFGINVTSLATISNIQPPKLTNVALIADKNSPNQAFDYAKSLRSSTKRVHVIFDDTTDLSMMDEIIKMKENNL
jgi:ATP phosphoribosyltransferase regulatory subunit